MVDVCDPTESYSVQRFQADARSCADGLLAEGRTPVLCGGTGLYLDAVIDEMDFPAGEVGGRARSAYEDSVTAERGPEGSTRFSPSETPERSSSTPTTRRVVRALEMLDEGVSWRPGPRGPAEAPQPSLRGVDLGALHEPRPSLPAH